MSKPSWFDSTNQIWELSEGSTSPTLSNVLNLEQARGLWLVSFIQDLRTLKHRSYQLGQHELDSYSGIQEVLAFLQMDAEPNAQWSSPGQPCTEHELAWLACLFLISVILYAALYHHDEYSGSSAACDLDSFDVFLIDRRHQWKDSVEELRQLLFQGLGGFPEGAQKTIYASQMAQVLGSLSSEARHGVERCLLHILHPVGDRAETMLIEDDGWTPDSLLSTVHGL